MSLPDQFSLEGKYVIVTGASKGIGCGVSKELAKAGARVALVARTRTLMETCKQEIGDRRGRRRLDA